MNHEIKNLFDNSDFINSCICFNCSNTYNSGSAIVHEGLMGEDQGGNTTQGQGGNMTEGETGGETEGQASEGQTGTTEGQ